MPRRDWAIRGIDISFLPSPKLLPGDSFCFVNSCPVTPCHKAIPFGHFLVPAGYSMNQLLLLLINALPESSRYIPGVKISGLVPPAEKYGKST